MRWKLISAVLVAAAVLVGLMNAPLNTSLVVILAYWTGWLHTEYRVAVMRKGRP